MTRCLMIIHHHTKFGKKTVEWFRRHCPDKIGHMDRKTDRQMDSDSNIQLCIDMGWGVGEAGRGITNEKMCL